MIHALHSLLPPTSPVRVVDVGAADIDGEAPWESCFKNGGTRVVGFEPNPAQWRHLAANPVPGVTWLPHAVGDGRDGVLHICRSPGMTSLLTPDPEVLRHLHGFPRWAEVVSTLEVPTRRLDDCPETEGVDWLKIDVQGGERGVLEGAAARLATVLCVHIEVQFVPFYKDQPLFAELDTILRGHGLWLHTFTPLVRRALKPLLVNNDIYAGINQVLWADAVYVRPFAHLDRLEDEALLKLARICHEGYKSLDLAALCLKTYDERRGTGLMAAYLSGRAQKAA